MTSAIPAGLRRQVCDRAQGKCEYCLLGQAFSIYTHEVDHVIAQKHDGQTTFENLALACFFCNRYKGADLTTFDPATGMIALLFNPRSQIWLEHFVLNQSRIEGITPVGRATAKLLRFNVSARMLERQVLMVQKQYP
jgi:HNH endonuclease